MTIASLSSPLTAPLLTIKRTTLRTLAAVITCAVLACGGDSSSPSNAATNAPDTFSPIASMSDARIGAALASLNNGLILLAGASARIWGR